MRKNVVSWMAPLHAVAVENPVHPGTPDVNFIEGWIELKQMPEWPVRPETPLRVDHFRNEQKIWLKHRWRSGGNVWLLLQVKREWLLFSAPAANEYLGQATREMLIAQSEQYWEQGVNQLELVRRMAQGRTDL